MECFRNIEDGIYLETPKIYLTWDTHKDSVIALNDSFELVNDSYYTLKVKLSNIPFVDYLGIHFNDDKISKIEMFNKHENVNDIANVFYDNQTILEKSIGKPIKQSFSSVLFRGEKKKIKHFKWKFKNIELIHKLWDRFGLEERLEIIIKH